MKKTNLLTKLSLSAAVMFAGAALASTAAAWSILIDDFSGDLMIEASVDEISREFVRDSATGLVVEILTVERTVDSSTPQLIEAVCDGTNLLLEIEGEDIAMEVIVINHESIERGEWAARERFTFAVEREMKESGEKGGTTDMNIGLGELQECTISKGESAAGDANLDGEVNSADSNPAATGDADLDGDFDSDDLNQALTGDFNGDGEVSGADF